VTVKNIVIICYIMVVNNWFDKNQSDTISLPSKNNFKSIKNSINFGQKQYNSKFNKSFKFKNPTNVFNFEPVERITETLKLKKLRTQLKNVLDRDPENSTKIKTIKTKIIKEQNSLNKCTISKKITIYPTEKQKKIIHKWFYECIKVYNKCVELYEKDKKYFDLGYMKRKIDIFKILYDGKKPAPYDMLTDEVRIFCSNLKSAETNLSNNHIRKFNLNKKEYKRKNYSIFIPKTTIKNDSIYKSHLGKVEGMKNVKNIKTINDCRLIYIKDKNRYELIITTNTNIKNINNREKVVALDPGEKIFMSYFGEKTFGMIGENMRTKILEQEKEIRRLQRIFNKGQNKKGKKLKNKKKIQKKIRRKYNKINDIVKELHNKTALFLCKNYEKVLIPEFETQKMVKNKIIKKENISREELKEKLKEYTKERRLDGRVKFCLNMLSHYRFRQHLINKSNEYGCKIYIVTEEYTSKTCTKCGHISEIYKNRIKDCEKCKYKINRDINGARNILLKNIKKGGREVAGIDVYHRIVIKKCIEKDNK